MFLIMALLAVACDVLSGGRKGKFSIVARPRLDIERQGQGLAIPFAGPVEAAGPLAHILVLAVLVQEDAIVQTRLALKGVTG